MKLKVKGEYDMWTSAELKERAKVALTGTYWKAFAVSLILTFLSGGTSGSVTNRLGSNSRYTTDGFGEFGRFDSGALVGFVAIFLVILLVVIVFATAFQVFVSNPIQVGARKYFVEAAEAVNNKEQARFNLLGFAFKGEHYLDIIKTMFITYLTIFLWSLLLIIPGIIKGYSYKMVPYILADNPHIGVKRAMELSNNMTYGEKMDMFILDLSFIGWYLLGLLLCGIGMWFVNPYYNATQAELYRVLREGALEGNMCSFEELGFSAPEEEVVVTEEY